MIVNNLKYTFSTKPEKGNSNLSIRFKDGYLYYPEYPLGNSLLFNGLTEMNTEDYTIDEFDGQLPYIDFIYNVLKKGDLLKGYTAFKELFIDNITKSILQDLNLPYDFLELFLYANELLTDNEYTHETRASSYRIRGYEMISTALYRTIASQYMILKQKGFGPNSSLSIPQDAVIKALTKSQILENYDTINPINELKSKAACTYKGEGLIGSQAKHGFTLSRRSFGEDAVGIFAESNVDNHQVGISKELTVNPNFTSTRGYIQTTDKRSEIAKMSASQTMSPDELISPDVTKYDHPNRVGFSSGQWKHTLGVTHNCLPMVSSGYDKTVAYQIGDTFVRRAKQDGKILDINEDHGSITVEYKNGTKEVYKFGKEFVRNSNFFLENNLELNVKIGQAIKKDDILAYSKEFFIKQGKDIIFTQGAMARIALMDDYFTEDDSTLVSAEFANLMANPDTKRKQVVISGTANIVKMVKENEYIEHGNALMLFEDSDESGDEQNVNQVLDMLGTVDEDALNSLKYHSPKANASGTISKIDIYWTGEFDEMSTSCKKLIKDFIKQKKEEIDYEERITGKASKRDYTYKKSVPVFNRINGAVMPDSNGILIEFYITHNSIYGTGDKSSCYPALKSVTAEIVPEKLSPYSESGPIDEVTSTIGLPLDIRQNVDVFVVGHQNPLTFDVLIEVRILFGPSEHPCHICL